RRAGHHVAGAATRRGRAATPRTARRPRALLLLVDVPVMARRRRDVRTTAARLVPARRVRARAHSILWNEMSARPRVFGVDLLIPNSSELRRGSNRFVR